MWKCDVNPALCLVGSYMYLGFRIRTLCACARLVMYVIEGASETDTCKSDKSIIYIL
jgi:hypothetical protein